MLKVARSQNEPAQLGERVLLVDHRYRIVRSLGFGGMAEVYLAHDNVLDRDVALKIMSERCAADDEFVERFKREAQSAAGLSHPNIVSIYDRGESENGRYYIAMEYLPGGTLKDRIVQRGALPPQSAAAAALQIAEALHAAHEAGVVHRDIKPHNVLVTKSGDMKVGDFGIARAATASTMTKTGSILGTPHYSSPEQAMGEPVGHQSDLYSLGVVLYEMLTGTLPYDAETSIGIAMKHVNGHLVPPRELNPEIPKSINAITTQLLAKNLHERYIDAGKCIKDLERVLDGLEPTAASTTLEMSRVTLAGMAQTSAMPRPPLPKKGKRHQTSTMLRPQLPKKRKRHQRRPWAPILVLVLVLLAMLGGLAYASPQLMANETKVPDLRGYASTEEAQESVGDSFKVREGNRLPSKEPIETIVKQNPKIGETANEGSSIFVDVSGTQVADLPNVEGETRDEAERILEEAGFAVEEETEESSAGNKGYVVDQALQGGDDQPTETEPTVKITVGAGPKTVQVPNLSALTPENARRALTEAGLNLGSQKEEPSSSVANGAIVSQDPVARSSAESDSSVDITVSSGPKQIAVPNVAGAYLNEAVQAIWDAGFGYTIETIQSDQAAGLVVSIDPPAGTQLDPNSRNVAIRQSAGLPTPGFPWRFGPDYSHDVTRQNMPHHPY